MKKFVAGALCVLAAASTATAADLRPRPIVKEPVPLPVWSWTGVYAGINGGYGIGTDNFSQFVIGNFDSLSPTQRATTLSSTIAPQGGFFGFQGGFNYQTGPVVWGIEGDWQWAHQTATTCGQNCSFLTLPLSGSSTFSVTQKVKWFGTARGRVGWTPIDGAMIYATAGAAWMGIDETDAYGRTQNTPGFPEGSSAASFNNTVSGYAVGGGAEARLWGNWTGKLEYLHIDVGGTTNTAVHSPIPVFGSFVLTTTTSRITNDVVRLGLNYKINPWGLMTASTPLTSLPVKAPLYRAPSAWSWSGFYLGVNGGYGVTTDDFREIKTYPNGVVQGDSINNTIAPQGGFFGFQGGFNYQTGPVVWGIEGDWQWAHQTATSCDFGCVYTTGAFPGFISNTSSLYQEVKWFGTARGRVGWTPIDGAMIYATAGAAWMGIDETYAISFNNPPFNPPGATSASFSNTVSGYAVGGGAEARLWGNWTGKLEYLHIDVGGTTNTALHSAPPVIGPFVLTTTTSRITNDIVRLGLNYKFGTGL